MLRVPNSNNVKLIRVDKKESRTKNKRTRYIWNEL